MSEFNAIYRKVCLGEGFDISAYKQCEKIYNHQQQKIDDITGRRAKNIAKDQTAKLNQAFEDARAKELGITKAKWLHSSAVKVPRHEHVKAHGEIYDIDKGIKFSNGWFKPAQDFGCKCRKYLVIDIPDNMV